MKTATLITGLQMQQVRIEKFAHYDYVGQLPPLLVDDNVLLPMEDVKCCRKIVPITKFCKPGRPDVYIAYSEEVEELLGFPARVMLKDLEGLRKETNYLRNDLWRLDHLTSWQHIKLAWAALLK